MEKVYEMENETEIVYACPFCSGALWFSRSIELVNHINRTHIRQLLFATAERSKRIAHKSARYWFIEQER